MKFKYIIVLKDGIEHPILFSQLLDHAEVAKGLSRQIEGKFVDVVSAGFCDVEQGFSCWGKAVSLGGIGSRSEDSYLILRNYAFSGV
jgi:hypothetical protein